MLLATVAFALFQVDGRPVDYRDGDVQLEGYVAFDKSVAGKRPAVVIVHEWRGHGEYVRMRAREIAKLGYVAFAADMYGKGVFAKDHAEAMKLSGTYFQDRPKMRARAAAALEWVKKHERVDAKKIAAMGYCFGGTTSLEMARAGLDVVAVASFHGNLSAADPAKEIKARVIVFHGAEDKFIPKDQIAAFEDEMRGAKADWQFVSFGGAVHSFTVKEAGDDPSKGMAYHPRADERSWSMLRDFLAESFR